MIMVHYCSYLFRSRKNQNKENLRTSCTEISAGGNFTRQVIHTLTLDHPYRHGCPDRRSVGPEYRTDTFWFGPELRTEIIWYESFSFHTTSCDEKWILSFNYFPKRLIPAPHHGTRRFYPLWISDDFRYRATVTTNIVWLSWIMTHDSWCIW